MNDIDKAQPAAIAVSSPMQLLREVIDKGLNSESVAVFGELLKYQREMEADTAKKDFARDFIALQAEMQHVSATREVKNKDGSPRYSFVPYEDLMRAVAPILKKHNFTVSFSTDYTTTMPFRLIKTCILTHAGGHSQRNDFAVRISEIPGNSMAQCDGGASTFAKRYALCDALNIVCDHDDDARAEGGAVSDEQAAMLELMVKKLKIIPETFLAHAGADSFALISVSKYEMLLDALKKRERGEK